MIEENIYDKDILVVDRAEEPFSGDVVVVQVERKFFVRRLYHDVCGPLLGAGNPHYRDILTTDTTDWEIWAR